jgi:hypothetical protein
MEELGLVSNYTVQALINPNMSTARSFPRRIGSSAKYEYLGQLAFAPALGESCEYHPQLGCSKVMSFSCLPVTHRSGIRDIPDENAPFSCPSATVGSFRAAQENPENRVASPA